MARTGRPKKEISQDIFESLCAIQCTETEICSVLECSEDTLNRWCRKTYGMTFAETFKNKSKRGKASLRRTQFKLAEKNAAMAIFLGKQYLGQKDEPEQQTDSGVQIIDDL
jgi:AraC-like DNA-binding protein